MQRLAGSMGLAATAAVLALAGSAAAHADPEDDFVRQARSMGISFNDENIISMGRGTCSFLYPGRDRPADQIIRRMMRYTLTDFRTSQQFVIMAVNLYCPQYSYRVTP